MSISRDVLQRLDTILLNQKTLDEHLHNILRNQATMSEALDRLRNAVDGNSAATDNLSAEVAEAVDYIKNHPTAGDDPELVALAERLEAKNEQALKASTDLDDAVTEAIAVDHAKGM